MNRREFLRRSVLGALMATPAMRAAALVRDFGLPAVYKLDVSEAGGFLVPQPIARQLLDYVVQFGIPVPEGDN